MSCPGSRARISGTACSGWGLHRAGHYKGPWLGVSWRRSQVTSDSQGDSSMTTRLTGQDSVDPAGMHSGLDVYCGYDSGAPGYRNGSFSNMAAIRARFPGKRYLSVGYDCIDVEPGLASPGEAPAFVRNWTRHNTAKPVVYANASQMPSVKSALNAAGIPRDHYFLWLAEWDGNPAIPFGYDGKQYASTQGYDSDSFWDYVFTGATPPAPNSWPLQQGSAGPAVTSLQ